MSSELKVDTISEKTTSNGVAFSNELKVDTISEKTTASGVTIDGVLIKDGAIASSYISGLTSGLTEADVWEITSNISLGAEADITAWVRPNGTLQNYLGTGMSHSSGIFTFPSTGFWLVVFEAQLDSTQAAQANIKATNDNSTYTTIGSIGLQYNVPESSDVKSVIVDVTDTANDKVKFSALASGGTSTINGLTSYTQTNVKFIKLGDT